MTDDDGANQLLIVGRRKRSPRKFALLNTAIELFAARGYHGVTIRDIGDEMGMTSASLYRHYESKEALLADAIDLVIHPMVEAIELICARDLGAEQRLRAAVSFHVNFALEHRTYLRVYYTEARQLNSEHLARHRKHTKRYRDAWLSLLIDAGAAKDNEDASHLYLMTMAMLNLGSNQERRSARRDRLDWVIDRTMALLMRSEAGS